MTTGNWRDRCKGKLVPLTEAIATVQSGDVVHVAPYSTTPQTLCGALAQRARDGHIRSVRIDHPAAGYAWTAPDIVHAFELHDNYATPPNRAACHAGDSEYLPIGIWKSWELPAGLHPQPDVFLVPVSPPNENGFCSLGQGVWMSRTAAGCAKRVIAEVQEDFIRTYGENWLHLDEIDLLVEGQAPPGGAPAPGPTAEEIETVDIICSLVAAELVNDGDTLQMGVGTVSAALGPYLEFRNDLGVQTELITGGIAELVRKGVVNGRYKTLHPHKVVGSACVVMPDEELAMIHENPIFELYDFGYTDDLRRLIQQENFVAVNNALVVDLTGQVSAEALDHRPYTGVGGQTVFMLAGAYSKGGRSVSVVPSSSVPSTTGQRVSRIIPSLNGAPVTVPRTYVDYVVTEHGIAELRGKTLRERAGALVEIAHPDFREELASEARRMFHI